MQKFDNIGVWKWFRSYVR